MTALHPRDVGHRQDRGVEPTTPLAGRRCLDAHPDRRGRDLVARRDGHRHRRGAPGEAGRRHSSSTNASGPGRNPPERSLSSHPELRFDEAPYKEKVEGLMSELRALPQHAGLGRERHRRDVERTRRREHPDRTRRGATQATVPVRQPRDSGGDVFCIVTLVGDEDEAEHTVDAVIDTVERSSEADEFDVSGR